MPTLRRARAVPVGNKTPRTKDTSRTREDRIGERITPQPNGCWTYDGGPSPRPPRKLGRVFRRG